MIASMRFVAVLPTDERDHTRFDIGRRLRFPIAEPAVFVGHSIGSLIVRMLASRLPDRVADMVYDNGTIPEIVALEQMTHG
jgi:pimeloyl-ACP methyl ester carboxylesterase